MTDGITVEEWNESVPVGTSVLYFPLKGSFDFVPTKTRSEAWALGHGAVVVMVEGRSGGVSVEHIRIAP